LAPQVADAFEKGGGVQFADVGMEGVTAFDLINRGQYEHRFTSYWLKTMPRVVARLEDGGRALDVGCGAGRVCVAIAKDFPKADITRLDPDEESIRQAHAAAEAAGLANRICFLAGTTEDLDPPDGFDLITACDCIHDFAEPHSTLRKLRELLKPDGTLFILGPSRTEELVREAGFRRFEMLEIKSPVNLFYAAQP
jgi:2-polyprenyl-3-methyl-5-hydroxy-6-metoxy-1,4-benzoquinol methylase